MRKGKGYDAILESSEVFLTAEEVGKAFGWSPDLIRSQARENPASLGFRVIVIGTRVHIPRIPLIEYIGLQEVEK